MSLVLDRKKVRRSVKTVTSEIRSLVDAKIASSGELKMTMVAHQIMDHFQASRSGDWERFKDERAYQSIYEIVVAAFGKTRKEGDAVIVGETLLKTGEVERSARKLSQRWANWREHVDGLEINLLTMTKQDLLKAAAIRRQRAGVELVRASLWETLAEQMTDAQVVGDCYSADDIETIYQGMNEKERVPWESSTAA